MEYLKMKAKQFILSILFIPILVMQSFATEPTIKYLKFFDTHGYEKVIETNKEGQATYKEFYNTNNQLIGKRYYDEYGTLRKSYKYNQRGQLIEKVKRHGDKNIYKYDDNGNLILEERYVVALLTERRLYERIKYTYNDEQKLVHKKTTNLMYADNAMITDSKIDSNGNEVESVSYQKGKLISNTTRTFFKNGKVKQECIINHDDNSVETKDYDDLGNEIALLSKDNKGHIYKAYKKYNRNRVIENETYHIEGKKELHFIYRYNNKNKLIEKIAENKYDTETTYYSHKTFAYDKKLRIIEEKIFNKQGRLIEKVVSNYSLLGKRQKRYFYDDNNQLKRMAKLKYSPWHEKVKTKKIYDDNGKLETKIEYGYKLNKTLSSNAVKSEDEKITHYK